MKKAGELDFCLQAVAQLLEKTLNEDYQRIYIYIYIKIQVWALLRQDSSLYQS